MSAFQERELSGLVRHLGHIAEPEAEPFPAPQRRLVPCILR
jgi:hypothetical protein